ncbi:MAG: hypothetical protein IKU60_03320 [Clostridia bacterium]|nr:hypothetical protein [Clostridia bacterium]
MRILKNGKQRAVATAICLVIFLLAGYFYNMTLSFYEPDIDKVDISAIIKKENLSDEDLMTLFTQTGVSPQAIKDLGNNGMLISLQEMYFNKPEFKKNYICFPITAEEKNTRQRTPLVKLKKGDIFVSFSTHTLNWRHGHCAIVTDAGKGIILEHMSAGNASCLSKAEKWGRYPAFAVLRYNDEKVASKAADYAIAHLKGVDYNILTGIVNKDKSDDESVDWSHCSHIVWQAYKAVGVDLDSDGGVFVTPEDIAMSEELGVVQIYGINTERYKARILK